MTSPSLPLRVDAAQKKYGAVQALAGASLEVQPGKLIGLLGPNGAGKTTLIRAIAGRVVLDAGTIELFGRKVTPKDPRPEIWASAMGTIEQHPVTGLGFGRGIARRAMVEELGNILFGHAHNLLLETAVGSGLPGAALLLFLICMTAYNGWRLARGDDAQAAVYGIALVGIVAGMFVRNMTDVQLARQNALLYWGVVGMMLGLGSVRRASKLNSTLRGDLRHPTR